MLECAAAGCELDLDELRDSGLLVLWKQQVSKRKQLFSCRMICANQACWYGVIEAAGQQERAAIVLQHTTIDDRNPAIANLPTHTSAKGLKPKMPSSTGSPMFSENCSNIVSWLVLSTPD